MCNIGEAFGLMNEEVLVQENINLSSKWVRLEENMSSCCW
jgi:hypothetical protein